MFPKPVSVKAIEKYKIVVLFDDGVKGELDLAHLAGKGVFQMWEENDNFFKVRINPEGGGIGWSDELDICPNNTYLQIRGISFEEWRSLNQEHATAL